MRRSCLLLAAAAAAGLAACNRDPPMATTAAASSRSVRPLEAAPLSASSPAFIGRWAAAPEACRDQAWTIAADELRSPGPLSCSLDRVRPTVAGYVVNGHCQVGKAAAPGRLVFTMVREGPNTLLTLDGGPFAEPMALTRCSEPAQVRAEAGPAEDRG